MELELVRTGGAAAIASVDSKVKAALTRAYNKSHLAVVKRAKGGRAEGVGRFTEDGDEDDDGEEEEEDDDDDGLVVQKKQPAPKGKGKGKAKA